MATIESPLVRLVLLLGRTPFGRSGNGRAHGLLRIFPLAEYLLSRGHAIRHIRPGGMIRFEVNSLPAADLPLPDHMPVRKGEPVIILHFDNRVVGAISERAGGDKEVALAVLAETRADLCALAERVQRRELPPRVRAVWAETLIYSAMARLGFHTRPSPPTLRTAAARLYMLALMAIHRADGLDHLLNGRSSHYRLGEAWMGVDELLRRYGSANPAEHPDQHAASTPAGSGSDEQGAVPD
jgi:hypothetical protein